MKQFLSKYQWYRKWKGGTWYLHEFTRDASELTFIEGKQFWATYPKINRYSKVIFKEIY